MMLGVSGNTAEPNSTPVDAAAVDGEQRSAAAGTRWPRQETMALLKIRSEMDAAFRDSSLKGPLWEQVSRKMVELGYHRNAKKCREKFENVFKYHKRTKEGRSSKSEGKTYKFFDQLAALENVTMTPPSQSSVQHLPAPAPPHPMAAQMQQVVVHADPISVLPPAPRSSASPNVAAAQPLHHQQNYATVSNSSSTSSDEDTERRGKRKRKRKRKEEEYMREVMKGVVEKQLELQKRFFETLEMKERERIMREEAWRNQEMERMKRESELLAQERSMAATRHSTLVSFLEKMTHQSLQNPSSETNYAPPFPHPPPPLFGVPQLALTLTPPPRPALTPPPPPQPPLVSPPPVILHPSVVLPPPVAEPIISPPQDHNVGVESSMSTGSLRWPKGEIEALITIRSSLDNKYQENGPKGPLWEEVSTEMKNLGYNRSSKRCKEKWENINKYFKKVKDNNKKRSEASKTCPYFLQLDALYKKKAKGTTTSDLNYSSYATALNPDNAMMHIISQPEEDPEREDVEYEEAEGGGGHQ